MMMKDDEEGKGRRLELRYYKVKGKRETCTDRHKGSMTGV